MKRNLQLLLVILFLAIASGNLAANDSTYIHHFPYTEYINSILDMGDYLWLATNDGLVKFDKKTEKSKFFYPGQSGIPVLNIKALCTDQKNNLWIGYDQGIAKFDGAKWDIIDDRNSPIPNVYLTGIIVSKKGHIWISLRSSGLYEYSNVWKMHNMSTYPNKNMGITSMKIDSNDVLWLASSTLGLMRYDGKNWKIFDTTNSKIPSNRVNSVAIDKEGNKWLATSRGLARLSDTGWTVWNTKNSSILQDSLYQLTIDQHGSICVQGNKGISIFKDGNFTNFHFVSPNYSVTSMIRDSSDIFWIGTSNSGLIKFDGKTSKNIIPSTTEIPLNVYSIAFDKYGDMWLGSVDRVYKYDGKNYRIFDSSNSPINKSGQIRTIRIDSAGNIWFATDSKVFKYDGTKWEEFNQKNSPVKEIKEVLIDKKGKPWISQPTGLLKYESKSWTDFKPDDSLLTKHVLWAADFDEHGNIWILTDEGKFYEYIEPNWYSYTPKIIKDYIKWPFPMKIDGKGNKWFAGFFQLWKYDNHTVTEYRNPINPSMSYLIRNITFDKDNTPWLGTNYGLVKHDSLKPKIYGGSGTLFSGYSNNIDDICFDRQGNIWIAANGRLNVLYREGMEYPDNYIQAEKIKYKLYDPDQDTLTREVNSEDLYEILPGSTKAGGLSPVVTFKNETKDKQLQFAVGADIYKDGEYRLVYRKSKAVTAEALANPDSSGVQWVDEVGNTLYFPKDTNFKGLPPGGYVRVTFDPFVPNEIFDGHHGRMILRAFSENLSLPDSSAFPFEDQTDDTLSRVFISLNKLDRLSDNCKGFILSGSNLEPDQDIWVNRGVEVVNAHERCYQPRNAYQMTGEYLHETFTKAFSPVYIINRIVGVTDVLPGKRGGDTLTSHIIDVRKGFNSNLSFSYQRSGRGVSTERGWCDQSLAGPEHRVIAPGDTLHAVREPDELIVEFISADKENIEKLINPREEDWHILPRRLGAPPEKENPPLTIFGGGGYRTAFLEGDHDSVLTKEQGLRADVFDDGKDDSFKGANVTIPNLLIKNGAYMRIRFRVNAQNNSVDNVIRDDDDNFYLDDFELFHPTEITDISLQSIKIENPYGILALNSTNSLSPLITVRNNTSINAQYFWAKLRLKFRNYPEWGAGLVWDEHHDGDGDGFCDFCGAPMYDEKEEMEYNKELEIYTLSHFETKSFKALPWKISDLKDYIKPGRNVVQMWCNLIIPGGDMNPYNDTLYTEQEIYFDSSYGYDYLEKTRSDVSNFTYIGYGLNLRAHSGGDDSMNNIVGDFGGSGSGQIAMKFTLDNKDTVFGFQAYFTSFATAPDPIRFAIYKDNNGKPGELVPGSILNKDRGMDDFRKEWLIEEFSTYIYDSISPVPVLDRGTYWAAIIQPGVTGLQLGGQSYRAGMVTTVYDSLDDGNKGMSLFIDKSLRKGNATSILGNDSPWYYENNIGSGNWVPFAPTVGNPGYSHLDHAGTIRNGSRSARTYSRGTFVPMLRVYMDGSHYKPSDVENQAESLAEKIHAFPNPAVNLAVIDYVVEKPGLVDITISNMFGEDVRELFSGYRAAGNYELPLSAKDMPSGMYLIRLKQASGTATAKLMIVK